MTAIVKKAVNAFIDGVNSAFYGDTTLLVKRKYIENDSEALWKDWEAVGKDIIEVTKTIGAEIKNDQQKQEEAEPAEF